MKLEIPKFKSTTELKEFITNHIQTNYPDLPLNETVSEILTKIYDSGYEKIKYDKKSNRRQRRSVYAGVINYGNPSKNYASIRIKGKSTRYGPYTTELEAHEKYKELKAVVVAEKQKQKETKNVN
jgi:hypothetical protein